MWSSERGEVASAWPQTLPDPTCGGWGEVFQIAPEQKRLLVELTFSLGKRTRIKIRTHQMVIHFFGRGYERRTKMSERAILSWSKKTFLRWWQHLSQVLKEVGLALKMVLGSVPGQTNGRCKDPKLKPCLT